MYLCEFGKPNATAATPHHFGMVSILQMKLVSPWGWFFAAHIGLPVYDLSWTDHRFGVILRVSRVALE